MRYWWRLSLGIVVILLTGCSLGTSPISDQPSELVKWPYEKGTVIDDAFLEKLSFYVPTKADTRCVAVIKCDGSQVTFQEYVIKNGDTGCACPCLSQIKTKTALIWTGRTFISKP